MQKRTGVSALRLHTTMPHTTCSQGHLVNPSLCNNSTLNFPSTLQRLFYILTTSYKHIILHHFNYFFNIFFTLFETYKSTFQISSLPNTRYWMLLLLTSYFPIPIQACPLPHFSLSPLSLPLPLSTSISISRQHLV